MNRKEQNIAIFEDSMDWIEHKPAGIHSRAPITVTSQRTFKRSAQKDCRTCLLCTSLYSAFKAIPEAIEAHVIRFPANYFAQF